MLHYLKVKNFYSFREEQTFSLVGTQSTRSDDRFMTTSSGAVLAKSALIYGPNASGKTNFLKSFIFLNWFIRHSWQTLAQDAPISYRPFIFTDDIPSSKFELCTESTKGSRYISFIPDR